MSRIVVGTAGHIDHGKTTLVQTLTGINTDRLKEEKKRGISIELGFAPLTLPNGQKLSIVDVPGHERFIRHMLAGAFGIDIVLLIIAADEGIMPQTREHMDIIELLGIEKGIVVLTKSDMVDEEWIILMAEEIKEYLADGRLKDMQIIPVSTVNKMGLTDLLTALESMCAQVEERTVFGLVRMPIDRVFSIAGFGTVVTGTLWSGQMQVGESLELLPEKRTVKIRTLEVHNEKVNIAYAGQRVAVNLQGINLEDIKRGFWLASPGALTPSYRVNVKLQLLKSSVRTIKNWNRVRFHLGTEEAMGRVVLLDRDELSPGSEAYAQIVLEKPIVGYKGDPFILRYYSPVSTIGGGIVIDPNAPKQKRFNEEVLDDLMIKEEGTLYDLLHHELEKSSEGGLTLAQLTKKTGSTEESVKQELQVLIDDEKVVAFKEGEYFSLTILQQIRDKIIDALRAYHSAFPLRPGYSKEDMRSRYYSFMEGKTFNTVIKYWEQAGFITNKNSFLSVKGFEPEPKAAGKNAIKQIMQLMNEQKYLPPSLENVQKELDLSERDFQEIIAYLTSAKEELIRINQEMLFSREAIEEGKELLKSYFENHKELSLAEARDLFATSRKYMLPLLEYYDRIRFTRRIGEIRIKGGTKA